MIAAAFLTLLAALPASAGESAPPGWEAPVIPGHLPQWDCLDTTATAADTLRIGRVDGPVRLLRDGEALVEDTDFIRIEDAGERGVIALVFPADGGPGGKLCIVRYVAPALPSPRMNLYTFDDVPVLPPPGVARSDTAPESAFPIISGESTSPLDTGAYEIELSGSKSIAVSVGQGGALGLDAALFVNLEGQIAENVWLEGSLSDQNVPVQPEGNTTTLREVDNKYLRVYGRQYEYLLGDYNLEHGRAGEDLFFIQAEGARLRYGDGGRSGTVSFARSKGLFHSDTLRGVDGKQRGYYLRGRDGNTYITVLAGTERIWRNGVLLRRGTDYTIDYSQGRIDFTNNVWVTGENLFSAEFQYTEDSYPRILVAAEVADTLGPFRFSLRAIQESEDKENPATGLPDAATLQEWEQAGDAPVFDSLGNPVRMPQRLGAAVWSADWEGGEAGQARFSVLGSVLDRNLYSGRDNDDNLGWSTRYRGVHRFGAPINEGGVGRLIVEPEHEHRSRDYNSFRQLVETRTFRDLWNLDAAVGERDFDANRVRVGVELWTGVQVGGGAGYAAGTRLDTTGGETVALPVESRRGEVFYREERRNNLLELNVEWKNALDPLRRDNQRVRLTNERLYGGWKGSIQGLYDEWVTEISTDVLARSDLVQPRAALESPLLGDRWIWTTEVDGLYGRSNYDATLAAPEDSLIDMGVAQRLRLLAWGPAGGDLFVARRSQRVWLPQTDGGQQVTGRALEAEEFVYHQAEANLFVSNMLRGYGAHMHYRATRTAETPLVESFVQVDSGRGDYIFDPGLNAYFPVETGGDYVLVGLVRDTTVGERPYQDLQWSFRLDLSPGRWLVSPGGVLADIDFSLDVETDHQDSAGQGLPLPRFTDAQIEEVRSGRTRYEPALRWTHPEGGRSAHLRHRREFAREAGAFASRSLLQETRGEYRHEWSLQWESAWIGALESRQREGLSAFATLTRVDTRRAQTLLYRRFPGALTLIPSLEYRHTEGDDAGFPVDLQAIVPRARVEKGGFFGGRASAEYGVHWLFGEGDGGFFVTDGYRRGVTHRFEAVAQSALQSRLHLNASYLARLDPGEASWAQRFSAEVRAVF